MLAVLLALSVAGCGGDKDDQGATSDTGQEVVTTTSVAEEAERPSIGVKATDYAFEIPATISGGLVDLTLDNAGKEPHFAAFAQPAEGKTVTEAREALIALASGQPPAGPPPFVEYMGLATVDPGGQSRVTANLPSGMYILFCMIPSPDGAPHAAKGMLSEVEVTGGSPRDLPATDATILTFDFAIGDLPSFKAGPNGVTLHNKGKQIHELDLIELAEGKKVEDVVAWAAKPAGPPPGRFLGGPAVRDGLSVNTTLELKAGPRYALVCIIPDSLGDGAPHITKGMHSPEFQVKA